LGAAAEVGVIPEGERFGLAVTDQHGARIFFYYLARLDLDELVEAVGAGRFQAGFAELFDYVGFGLAETFAASVAAFHAVVG